MEPAENCRDCRHNGTENLMKNFCCQCHIYNYLFEVKEKTEIQEYFESLEDNDEKLYRTK